jgi:hypothetical protein
LSNQPAPTSPALNHALGRAKGIWDYAHRTGLISRFLRRIGVGRTVTAIWICRHTDGDWDKAKLAGEPAEIWRYDGDGLAVVDALPTLDLSRSMSSTPVLRFCEDESGQRMIYTEWSGRLSAVGLIMRANEKSWWTIEKRAWMS